MIRVDGHVQKAALASDCDIRQACKRLRHDTAGEDAQTAGPLGQYGSAIGQESRPQGWSRPSASTSVLIEFVSVFVGAGVTEAA